MTTRSRLQLTLLWMSVILLVSLPGIASAASGDRDRLYGTGNTFDLRLSQSGLMFHHIDRAVCSKPFVTLVCCDNLEGLTPHNVLDYFKVFSMFMDAPQVGILVHNDGPTGRSFRRRCLGC